MKVIFCMCLLLCLGCTSYQNVRNGNPQVTLDEIVEVGNSEDPEMAVSLSKLLENRTSTPESFDEEKTVETIIALQKLNPSPAQQQLIKLIQNKDEDEEVRYYAVETLAEIRNSKSVVALASFIENSSPEDDLVLEAASRSLSKLTLIPIHKDGEDTREKWQEWWKTMIVYFNEESTNLGTWKK